MNNFKKDEICTALSDHSVQTGNKFKFDGVNILGYENGKKEKNLRGYSYSEGKELC